MKKKILHKSTCLRVFSNLFRQVFSFGSAAATFELLTQFPNIFFHDSFFPSVFLRSVFFQYFHIFPLVDLLLVMLLFDVGVFIFLLLHLHIQSFICFHFRLLEWKCRNECLHTCEEWQWNWYYIIFFLSIFTKKTNKKQPARWNVYETALTLWICFWRRFWFSLL